MTTHFDIPPPSLSAAVSAVSSTIAATSSAKKSADAWLRLRRRGESPWESPKAPPGGAWNHETYGGFKPTKKKQLFEDVDIDWAPIYDENLEDSLIKKLLI